MASETVAEFLKGVFSDDESDSEGSRDYNVPNDCGIIIDNPELRRIVRESLPLRNTKLVAASHTTVPGMVACVLRTSAEIGITGDLTQMLEFYGDLLDIVWSGPAPELLTDGTHIVSPADAWEQRLIDNKTRWRIHTPSPYEGKVTFTTIAYVMFDPEKRQYVHIDGFPFA